MTASLTVDALRTILGREIDEIHLTAAKASALGLDADTIASNVGLEPSEIHELMQTQDYKDVRLLVGSEMLTQRVERDTGWDGIENAAVRKLQRRTELENDTETLLKIAAVANRATRRTAPPKEAGPLDPSQAGQRVPLTLTRRYTEQLGADGSITRSTTQQISVLNGSAVNPKFEDVKRILSGAADCSPIDSLTESHTPARQASEYPAQIADNSEVSQADMMQELMKAAARSKR